MGNLRGLNVVFGSFTIMKKENFRANASKFQEV
jgi:hypothetical protein